MTKPFETLDPNVIMAAVEGARIPCTGLIKALNSMENRVYQIEGTDRTRWVAKFYRPGRWSREAILDEHRFLAELAADGIPVIAAERLPSGETVGETGGFYWALFRHRAGRPPQEFWEEGLTGLGRLIARIHVVGERAPARHRLELTPAAYGLASLTSLRESGGIPEPILGEYVETVEALVAAMEPLLADIPRHRIHGDFHRGNLISGPDGIWLVDFDDMCTGPAVQDLWLVVSGQDDEAWRQRELVMSGYQQVRPFDADWLNLVEPLRALRLVHYAAWIARRWDDPAFPRHFPLFGTEEYWAGELSALQETLRRIRTLSPP